MAGIIKIAVCLVVVALTGFSVPSFAADPVAGDPCTNAGQVQRERGPAGATAGIICNGTVYETFQSFDINPLRQGIGTATPEASLHVDGEAIIGNTSLACSATTEGAIRYDSAGNIVEFCDGTSWGGFAGVAGADRQIQFNSGGALGASSNLKYTADGRLEIVSGGSSVFIGLGAGTNDDGTANHNVGMGVNTLNSNSSGYYNTGLGYQALKSNTTGYDNTAVGSYSLYFNTGLYNTAVGSGALYSNKARRKSTAVGYGSMRYAYNAATVGDVNNTAVGFEALRGSTVAANNWGTNNAALGYQALLGVTSGSRNVAIGSSAGDSITTGADNIVIGYNVDTSSGGASNQLNIGNALYGTGILGGTVKIGVADSTPEATLDIAGEVKVGTTTGLSCSATTAGSVRYNATSKCLELCDGTSFSCISVAACGDASPDAFSFTGLVNQTVSTQVTSNIIQIMGLACTVNVAVSGEGSPQYRTCSDSGCSTVLIDWTSASGTIDNNSYIQLRLTTSAIGGDTYSATLSVGTGADVWDATTTGDCTGSPAVGTICADGTVYAGLSPDGNVKMYVTRCDVGMSWNGTTCTGTRSALPWNAGNTSGYVTTSQTSAVTGESNTSVLATTDADSVTGGTQDHVAAKTCNDLSQDGYTDWYLPARNELNVMYAGKTAIGNFNTGGTYYWSSTEDNNNNAWSQRFSDGIQAYNFKSYTYAVRCARR